MESSEQVNIKQQATAHRIMLDQLNRLNISPTKAEFSTHVHLLSNSNVQSSKLAQRWCEKILVKNGEFNIYNQEVLKEFLENVLQKKLNINT